MISICIPAHNYNPQPLVEQLLEQCLDTPAVQEIIIYDDASSTPIQLSIQHELVRIYRGENNLQAFASRKCLAEKATGNWLLFLDADLCLVQADFLERYAAFCEGSYDLIHSPIVYAPKQPEKEQLLRWKYGHAREQRNVEQPENNYDIFVSACFMVRKEHYLNLYHLGQPHLGYGADIYLSALLKKQEWQLLFIDNPVMHLGLESSKAFIEKSLRAVATTFINEQKGMIPSDLRPVQKAYKNLYRSGLTRLFIFSIRPLKQYFIKQLCSQHPKLLYLDLLKLLHYAELKR